MNQDGAWSGMIPDQEANFDEFLNVDDFNIEGLDFGDFDPSPKDGEVPHTRPEVTAAGAEGSFLSAEMPVLEDGWDPRHHAHDSMEANMARARAEQMRFHHQQQQAAAQQMQQHAAQQASQQQPPPQQQYMHGHMAVPPTPDSMEMHGRHAYPPGMSHQQARMMYESYSRKQQEQMVFTPLVSPAVTPLDTQFQIPEYAVPGEYFSPLTSPAMPAQVQQRSVYSSTSEGASPSDMEIDSPKVSSATAAAQKNKKAPKMQKATSRTVRQSPAMKPQQKRKPPTSTSIPAKDVAEIMEGFTDNGSASGSRPGSANLRIPSQKTSESGSTSPEPMSEVLMPPPATPRSAPKGRSPMLGPQNATQRQQQQSGQGPVTPATLMRLQKSSQGTGQAAAAAETANLKGTKQNAPPLLRPNLSVETRTSEDDLTTPTMSARDGSSSAVATPRTVPASPSAPSAAKEAPKPTTKGKKRNSTSYPSPALRPKISPSIKPLLPEGAFSADHSTLLLASKSNYQNLLEGNTLPGVTYPNALSANLTSKRTSHKLAEQGRRNRMNTALLELAGLLPAGSPSLAGASAVPSTPAAADGDMEAREESAAPNSAGGGADGSSSKAANASKEGNSKASTVEMAIDFIRSLQAELGVTRGRLADVEQKLGCGGSSTADSAEGSPGLEIAAKPAENGKVKA